MSVNGAFTFICNDNTIRFIAPVVTTVKPTTGATAISFEVVSQLFIRIGQLKFTAEG